MTHRVLHGALERLEPDEGKLSRPVLRGGSGRKAAPLPDNVTTRTDSDGTVTSFGYDAADQLNSEVRDNSHSTGYNLGYSYDHNANRLTKVVGT